MKKILVAVTSRDKYERSTRPTGLWLGEFVHFYEVLNAPPFTIEIASPRGGATPLDPAGLKGLALDGVIRAFQSDRHKMALLERTKKSSEVRADDYDAIYYTGGHGTMWDFPDDPFLQETARRIWERGGWVAAVCHGVAGLINLKLSDGEYLVHGKRMTGYSNREELFGGTRGLVPYSLEDTLRGRGAAYSRSFVPFVSHTREDGRLLTGQNPFSTRALAKLLRRRMLEPA